MRATQFCKVGNAYVDPMSVLAIIAQDRELKMAGCCARRKRRKIGRRESCMILMRAHHGTADVYANVSADHAAKAIEAAINALHRWEQEEWKKVDARRARSKKDRSKE